MTEASVPQASLNVGRQHTKGMWVQRAYKQDPVLTREINGAENQNLNRQGETERPERGLKTVGFSCVRLLYVRPFRPGRLAHPSWDPACSSRPTRTEQNPRRTMPQISSVPRRRWNQVYFEPEGIYEPIGTGDVSSSLIVRRATCSKGRST